ncbi:MAG TPA: PKD domain-containing protein [Phycisphaerales bacterium]|nr:PKD domain-containing protein [Phycisphaerales bacterium]
MKIGCMAVCAVAVAAGAAASMASDRGGSPVPFGPPAATEAPAIMAQVLNPAFDVAYQDGRTHESIQRDIAIALADPSYVYTMGDPDDVGPVSMCWAQGSEISVQEIEMLNALIGDGFETRYEDDASWSGTASTPTPLTWSFVPDGLSITGGNYPTAGSNLFATMDARFGGIANRQTWITQFTNVFNRWSALTGLSYTRVTAAGVEWDDGASWGSSGNDTTRGDIRISAKPLDGQNNVLAYNSFPTNGDMVMDSAESWGSSTNTYRFLRNVIAHEHGHGIGLSHVCPDNGTKLMEPLLATNFDGPQHDDMRGGQDNYGDAFEPNSNTGNATDWGTVAPGSAFTIGTVPSPTFVNSAITSISINGEVDYHKFNLDGPTLMSFTLTPVGLTYTTGPQTAQCNTGTSVNSTQMYDLMFDVYASNGTTLLATVNAGGLGATESYTGLLCSEGISFIRVRENSGAAEVQMYRVTVQAQNANLTPSASDGTFSDKVRVTLTSVANATAYRVLRNTVNSTAGATQLTEFSPQAGPTQLFDDTTAVPGTTYYYWFSVQQTGSTGFRLTRLPTQGESGFRSGAPNNPPVANAGADQVITDSDNNGSQAATLNGSGSTDSDGTIVSYAWAEGVTPLGAGVVISPALGWGSHTITLTVTDDDGAPATDSTVVRINRRPNAVAGPDQGVTDTDNTGSESVTLTAVGTTDPDGTVADYAWSEGVTPLGNGLTLEASFGIGVHTVTLTATDNDGGTHTDTVQVTVNPFVPNTPPNADAGPDQSVTDADNSGDEMVTLDGSASNDPDGTITAWEWTEGLVQLGTGQSISALLPVGEHTITLTVTDDDGGQDTDTVVVTVGGAPCTDVDFNNDGLFPDNQDLEDYFTVFGGGPCSTGDCDSIDFNGDGLFPDNEDLEDFLSVFGGGTC